MPDLPPQLSDASQPSACPRPPAGRWVPFLLGAAPHVALLVDFLRGQEFGVTATVETLASVPFALYGDAELWIVAGTVLVAALLGAFRRTRPWASAFLLGTLTGATAVLVALSHAATTWEWA